MARLRTDHLDLVWIDQSGPEIRSKRRFELQRAAQGDPEQIAHPDELAVEIDLVGFKLLLPRKGKELRNELRAALSSVPDQFDAFLIVRSLHCAGKQTRIGEHDTEQVVEIVRHA
jgi:hypothetical protein